jgi:hypothetical protein
MMLIWRCILLIAAVWLMAPLSALASPPLALENTILLQCVVISGRSNAQTTGVSMSSAAVSCEAFVQATQLNSAAREPGDPGGTYRRPDASGYMGWVEGFISGLNYMASTNRTAGQDLEPEAHLQWILNYCAAHPHEILLSTALAFRDDLIVMVNRQFKQVRELRMKVKQGAASHV